MSDAKRTFGCVGPWSNSARVWRVDILNMAVEHFRCVWRLRSTDTDKDNSLIYVETSFYIMEKINGHWGCRGRSIFAK
jgi:hypothetical protein